MSIKKERKKKTRRRTKRELRMICYNEIIQNLQEISFAVTIFSKSLISRYSNENIKSIKTSAEMSLIRDCSFYCHQQMKVNLVMLCVQYIHIAFLRTVLLLLKMLVVWYKSHCHNVEQIYVLGRCILIHLSQIWFLLLQTIALLLVICFSSSIHD